MPITLAAKGAVVAVSIAVATAIALYESPELRRYADDARRRIAMALHAIGDGIDPPHREPLFNRPEDAHGFMESRRGEGAEPGVDADEETRRRQREELLYWNSQRLEKEMNEKQDASEEPARVRRLTSASRGSSFDDFLRQDESAERGTFVFNSGTDTPSAEGLRRRGDASVQTLRGMPASVYANPFADEHFIISDDIETAQASQITPPRDDIMSDIYSATTQEQPQTPRLEIKDEPESLIDLRHQSPVETQSSVTLDRSPAPEEYMTPGQEPQPESHHDDAYASIQAWAQHSEQGFYSPLPSTPRMPVSEPGSEPDEFLSEGQLTPTDSVSIIGSNEDFGNDGVSSRNGSGARPYDVISESDGMMTPASWSEVGSVISESDVAAAPMHA